MILKLIKLNYRSLVTGESTCTKYWLTPGDLLRRSKLAQETCGYVGKMVYMIKNLHEHYKLFPTLMQGSALECGQTCG